MGIVYSHDDERKLAFLKKCNTRHFHISHNAPCLPSKILHNLCFSFLLVLQPFQEKLKTMLMQNFGGQIRCIMGIVEVAYGTKRDFLLFIRHLYIFHNARPVCDKRRLQTCRLAGKEVNIVVKCFNRFPIPKLFF